MTMMMTKRKKWLAAAAIAALLTACAATPQGTSQTPPITPGPNPAPDTPAPSVLQPFASSGHAEMDAWRDSFAARSVAAGHSAAIVQATLSGLRPLDLYLSNDVEIAKVGVGDQAEFAKPIWEYIASAVTQGRKSNGANKLNELSATFDEIEATYGVNREAITAIWAMETNLGSYIGNYDAANTLANMAVEGRRRTFAESELTALIKMQERGEVERDDLISGWAGAMGQTQFMPSTFLAYAVDFDGDGKKDLWNSAPDALASAANYLAVSGYQKDQPWGIEVMARSGFDWALADGQDRRMSTWTSAGLFAISGQGFPVSESDYAEFWLPAGATGPKYLLFKNFDVYKTYNRSDSYALAVGLLTDGVAGKNGPIGIWPTELGQLSNAQVKTLQAKLNQLGYDAGPVDGIAGRGTKGALRRFQSAYNIDPADGYPTQVALQQVLDAAG
ncbi:MAG: lytic murein transglycosylase [Henriciella sp.]